VSALSLLMRYYPYLFHPAVMVGGGLLVLVYLEWDDQDADREVLWKRYGILAGVGVLSFLPTLLYMLATRKGPMETMQGNAWQVDALVASGMLLVAGVLWYLWRRFEWGSLVSIASEAIAAVTLPYIALSPFWNVSGHVIFAAMPTVYLTLVDRRFWPLLLIPLVMIPNRIYLNAHSWAQSIAALVVTAAIVVWAFERRPNDSALRGPDQGGGR